MDASPSGKTPIGIGKETRELIEETVRKLQSIWTEIGLSDQEREQAIRRLHEAVAELCSESVKREKAMRDALNQNLLSLVKELLEISAQLGEDELELESETQEAPLRTRVHLLQSRLDLYRRRRDERRATLEALREQLVALWEELELEGPESLRKTGTELTLDRVSKYEEALAAARQERAQRQELISQEREAILALWRILERPAEDEFERAVLEGELPARAGTLQRLRALREQLEEERAQREQEAQEYARRITALWDRLRVSEEERERFLEEHPGLGAASMEACREELRRLELLQAQCLRRLCDEARARLQQLHDELHLSEEERCVPLDSSDEVLEELEALEARAREQLREYRPLIAMIERREALKADWRMLEAAAADPSRLLSKDRDAAGRLLREEKLRRVIQKELPRLEERLRAQLLRWEEVHQRPFRFAGERYLDVMQQDDEAARRRRDEDRMRREKRLLHHPAATPTAATRSENHPPAQQQQQQQVASGPRSATKPPRTPGSGAAAPRTPHTPHTPHTSHAPGSTVRRPVPTASPVPAPQQRH
jgi:protein regulator of cytokinesis 1